MVLARGDACYWTGWKLRAPWCLRATYPTRGLAGLFAAKGGGIGKGSSLRLPWSTPRAKDEDER